MLSPVKAWFTASEPFLSRLKAVNAVAAAFTLGGTRAVAGYSSESAGTAGPRKRRRWQDPPAFQLARWYVPSAKKTRRDLRPLEEAELEEHYTRGHGPGGQAVNKTNNAVSLIHKPTGIRVHCHESRSREINRVYARRRLQELVDKHENPGSSYLESQWTMKRARKEGKRKKQRKRARRAAEESNEGEGEDSSENTPSGTVKQQGSALE